MGEGKKNKKAKETAVQQEIWAALMWLCIWISHSRTPVPTWAGSESGVCHGLRCLPLRQRGASNAGDSAVLPGMSFSAVGFASGQNNPGWTLAKTHSPFLVRAWKPTPCRRGREHAEVPWCHGTSEESGPTVMSERRLVSSPHVWYACTSSQRCQWSLKTTTQAGRSSVCSRRQAIPADRPSERLRKARLVLSATKLLQVFISHQQSYSASAAHTFGIYDDKKKKMKMKTNQYRMESREVLFYSSALKTLDEKAYIMLTLCKRKNIFL